MACRIFRREGRLGNGDLPAAAQMNLTRLDFSPIE
jgi:hypothetical protein